MFEPLKLSDKVVAAACNKLLDEKAVMHLPDGSRVMGLVTKVRCGGCGNKRWNDGRVCLCGSRRVVFADGEVEE